MLLLLAGTVCLGVGALNGIVGIRLPGVYTAPVSGITIALFLACVYAYIKSWAKKHPRAFPVAPKPQAGAFGDPSSDTDIWHVLKDRALTLGLTANDCWELSRQIGYPDAYRDRVTETVQLGRRKLHRTVTIYMLPTANGGKPEDVVCFARPPKGAPLESPELRSFSDPDATLLPFMDAAAVTYAVCIALIRQYSVTSPVVAVADVHRASIARLVAKSDSNATDVDPLFRVATGQSFDPNVASNDDRHLHQLLHLALTRRPMYLRIDSRKPGIIQ